MEKEKKKSGRQTIRNMSTWAVVIFFVVICAVITVIIGFYSMKKEKEKDTENSQEVSAQTGNNGTENENNQTDADLGTTDFMQENTGEDDTVVTEGEYGALKITVRKSSEWGEESYRTSQYDVSILNTSGEEISDWKIALKFDRGATYGEQGWGAEFEMENGVLIATPVDYTQTIVAGQEVIFGVFVINAGSCEISEVTNK